jgi:methyl-accepting chemotaxis protein
MTPEYRPARPANSLALVLVAALALLGVGALLLAVAHGTPGWVLDAYMAAAALVLALYLGLVHLPRRRAEGATGALLSEHARLESGVKDVLAHLQAGELAAAEESTHGLPQDVFAAVRTASRALAALVQHIQSSSIEVAAAGNAVHATASDLASGSSQQAAAVVEITASMEELARTAAQIAGNAAAQAEHAVNAENSGNAGAAAVEEALHGVEEAQKRISAIASRADTLGSRSREIYGILDLINEIAQETHILSLNAAIEAAAAGEHGRRFSVVAEEVRRLAQRSRESVASVRGLLDEFVGAIRATVVATEEGSKEVQHVLERERAAAAAIDELRLALSSTARAAREISLATQQQRTASDQVVLTLKEVSQVTQRMAEGLKQFSGTADHLNQLALTIQLLTQSFNLDSPHSLKHLAEEWAGDLASHTGHWEAVAAHLDEMVASNAFIELAYLVDRSGNMVGFAATRDGDGHREVPPGIAVGANFADRPWFQGAARDGLTILTPLYDSLLTGERCFTVAVPVRDAADKLAAVLGFDVNVRSWTRI